MNCGPKEDIIETLSPREIFTRIYCYFPELGTRQHCRDNVTMSSGQKIVDYCIMSMLIVAT